MTADPLPALASAAEGGRELDALVAEAAGWKQARDGLWNRPEDVSKARRQKIGMLNYRPHPLPAFTTSVDAALTLVPDNRIWFVGHLDPTDMRFAATISCGHVGSLEWRAIHKSAAIAICLAALRAREAAP